jgi:hypothetical protein
MKVWIDEHGGQFEVHLKPRHWCKELELPAELVSRFKDAERKYGELLQEIVREYDKSE